MSKDKIIQFPGAHAPGSYVPPATPTPGAMDPTKNQVLRTADGQEVTLTPQQQKAMYLVLRGMPFVMVSIEPVPTGADFYTAIHGDHGDLRNALSHLPDVIERAYVREGITQ